MLDIISNTRIETWVMTKDELQAVFDSSEPGSVTVYAGGDLGHLRDSARGDDKLKAERTARYAYSLYERGEAQLVQYRHGPNNAEYQIVKCR